MAVVSFWMLFHPQISNLAGMSARQLPFSLSLSSNLHHFLPKFLYSFSNYVTTIVNLTGQTSFQPIKFYPTKLFNMTFETTTGISMGHPLSFIIGNMHNDRGPIKKFDIFSVYQIRLMHIHYIFIYVENSLANNAKKRFGCLACFEFSFC